MLKFNEVALIKSLSDTPLIKASFLTVYLINDGSFFFPLLGSGAKNGLSVSTNNFYKGIDLKVSCSSVEFLKVIIPLAEK